MKTTIIFAYYETVARYTTTSTLCLKFHSSVYHSFSNAYTSYMYMRRVYMCIRELFEEIFEMDWKKKKIKTSTRHELCKRSLVINESRPKMKLMVQIFCAIGECWTSAEFLNYSRVDLHWNNFNHFPFFIYIFAKLWLSALLVVSVMSQRSSKPNCYKYWLEDPDTIDQVYFPYKGNCQYFWQCTAHGAMR